MSISIEVSNYISPISLWGFPVIDEGTAYLVRWSKV